MWMMSALITIGALVACSPIQTPPLIATETIIPSTARPTNTPLSPTIIPLASNTPISLSTTIPLISIILESTVELNAEFTGNIMASLANELEIPINRIQLVSVEDAEWDEDSLSCVPNSAFDEIGQSDVNRVKGLRYVLLVGNTLYEYHTEGTARFLLCLGNEIVSGEVLLAVDPLAAETFRVVQNLLANELDLSSRRVQLVDMIPLVWEDSSLGCPQSGQTYTELKIPGYYIEVTVGNENYIYHSDSNTVYPCSLEQSLILEN